MRPCILTVLLLSVIIAVGDRLVVAEEIGTEGQSVSVIMKEYTFLPSHLIFKIGVSYRLHLVNEGKELHEFTAPDFFKSIEAKNPQLLANSGADIVLQPNEMKDLYFVPKRTGHFVVTCADHDWAGMTGGISVE